MNHPPIPISELAEHTELLKANDNLKLSQEYEVSGTQVKGQRSCCRAFDFCLIAFSLPVCGVLPPPRVLLRNFHLFLLEQ